MNRAGHRRSAARWARYVNHYGHIPGVGIGGWAAVRVMSRERFWGTYFRIRRQQPHGFGHGYRMLQS